MLLVTALILALECLDLSMVAAAAAATACNLPCRNGGTCRESNATMVCDCPTDSLFHGSLCQFEATPCGTDDMCQHGSVCVEPRGADDRHYFCDCTAKRRGVGVGYAGRYCEYEATSYCATNHNGLVFCVNGGECHEEGRTGSG